MAFSVSSSFPVLTPQTESKTGDWGDGATCLYETKHLYACLFRHMFQSQLDLFPGHATGSFDSRDGGNNQTVL